MFVYFGRTPSAQCLQERGTKETVCAKTTCYPSWCQSLLVWRARLSAVYVNGAHSLASRGNAARNSSRLPSLGCCSHASFRWSFTTWHLNITWSAAAFYPSWLLLWGGRINSQTATPLCRHFLNLTALKLKAAAKYETTNKKVQRCHANGNMFYAIFNVTFNPLIHTYNTISCSKWFFSTPWSLDLLQDSSYWGIFGCSGAQLLLSFSIYLSTKSHPQTSQICHLRCLWMWCRAIRIEIECLKMKPSHTSRILKLPIC